MGPRRRGGFPAAGGPSGRTTNRREASHGRRGTFGTPSDDGVPQVPLKSLYWWYSDFSAVQRFAPVSGSNPLAPKRCREILPAAVGPSALRSRSSSPIAQNICDISERAVSDFIWRFEISRLSGGFPENIARTGRRAGGKDFLNNHLGQSL